MEIRFAGPGAGPSGIHDHSPAVFGLKGEGVKWVGGLREAGKYEFDSDPNLPW
jgi:hypothetical protein